MVSLHKQVQKTFQKIGYFLELGPGGEGGMWWDGMGWNGIGCDLRELGAPNPGLSFPWADSGPVAETASGSQSLLEGT